MGREIDVIAPLHKKTKRDYLARMNDDKIACMKIAGRYGKEYWDGSRRFGYGGYKYDGRQAATARRLIEEYKLTSKANILDIGCGKGFLLYEFKKILPEANVVGLDISKYAIENAKPEVKPYLRVAGADEKYPFSDGEFDLVVSIMTLYNLPLSGVINALGEIERVGKNKFIALESYRDEKELFNLQCWALTCQAFLKDDEWVSLFNRTGYTGDYEFIYFE